MLFLVVWLRMVTSGPTCIYARRDPSVFVVSLLLRDRLFPYYLFLHTLLAPSGVMVGVGIKMETNKNTSKR